MKPEQVRMVYCDSDGQIYDHPELSMVVFDGMGFRPPCEDELVPLPPGSDVYSMPGHQAIKSIYGKDGTGIGVRYAFYNGQYPF